MIPALHHYCAITLCACVCPTGLWFSHRGQIPPTQLLREPGGISYRDMFMFTNCEESSELKAQRLLKATMLMGTLLVLILENHFSLVGIWSLSLKTIAGGVGGSGGKVSLPTSCRKLTTSHH